MTYRFLKGVRVRVIWENTKFVGRTGTVVVPPHPLKHKEKSARNSLVVVLDGRPGFLTFFTDELEPIPQTEKAE